MGDGLALKLNRSVVASVSGLLKCILEAFDINEEPCLIIDMEGEDLIRFYQFATKGTIKGTELSQNTKQNFAMLGINFDQLSFETVQVDEEQQTDPRTKCFASTINVDCETELLSKGEDFVRAHSVEHCIFGSNSLRPDQLVKILSQHYLKFHGRQVVRDLERTEDIADGTADVDREK